MEKKLTVRPDKAQKKELKKISRKYFQQRNKDDTGAAQAMYKVTGLCLCVAPFDPTGVLALGMSAVFISLGGAVNITNFFENHQKTICTNDAGQNLYGPDWAQDLNRAAQNQLYTLATELDKNPDDAKTKKTQKKLLEQAQDLQKLLTVVDGDGHPLPDENIRFLLQKAETRVIEVIQPVSPEIELDLKSGTALPPPKPKRKTFGV